MRCSLAQDRVHPVDAVDCRAAAAWLAFVARGRRVIEIKTARALQPIASRGGHIAQLRRSAGKDCACQQGIARLDLRVVGEIAVGNERADAQAAVCGLLDRLERQMGDVDQPRGARDILLDEIDQVRAAGDEPSSGVGRDLAHRIGDVARAAVIEIVHRFASPVFRAVVPDTTSAMAATMLG